MALTDGSSPRVRGKRTWPRSRWARSRIIPARAGQTLTSRTGDAKGPDHPRACGANISLQMSRTMPHGSSPRVRGKPVGAATVRVRRRIIPARAGQTTPMIAGTGMSPDHPRACGANSFRSSSHGLLSGSSPRVRGKPARLPRFGQCQRIIPARAGQTVRFYAKTLERWTLNNWIRTVAPIFVLLFLLPVIGQNAYIERHYSNQSFSWFSKLHYASAFDLSLVA